MGLFARILRDLGNIARGRRQVNFYFSTVSLSDALWALVKALEVMFTRSPHGADGQAMGRSRLAETVREEFQVGGVYLFGSARSGLYSVLKCLALEPDAEVLVTGFTCEVVPNAVLQAGYQPCYVDIDPANFCTNPVSVESRINEKTRVLVIKARLY